MQIFHAPQIPGVTNIPQFVELTERIIGAGIEVHRQLGPGLLESTYEEAIVFELGLQRCKANRQAQIPIKYKGVKLGAFYRPDLIVDGKVIVEIKAVEKLLGVHQAQLLTYLKVSGLKVGLLMNFNTQFLREGIKRISL